MGNAESAWTATHEIARRPWSIATKGFDVCVIGADIAGMSTAHRLALEESRLVMLVACERKVINPPREQEF